MFVPIRSLIHTMLNISLRIFHIIVDQLLTDTNIIILILSIITTSFTQFFYFLLS